MRVPVLLSCVLVALVCVSSVAPLPTVSAQSVPVDATAKVFVHAKLINLFQSVVNSILNNALTNMALPDATEKITGGSVDITNININYISFAAQDVGLTAPNNMAINLNNLDGKVTLDWRYHGPLKITFHGSATTTFANTNLNNMFQLSSDANGRPVVQLTSCDCSIGDLNIKLSGGGSTIWNLLIKLFKGTLKRTIASKIAAAASTQLNAVLAGVMQKYPLFVPLAGELLNTTQLNLPLVATTGPAGAGVPAPFAVANNYLIGGGNFFFSSTVNTTVDTRAHSPISNDMPVSPAGTPSMFGMAMSEHLLGSLLFTLTLNGKLEWHVDNDSLPPNAPFLLNTHLISSEWPTLYAKYPNNNMTLDFFQYDSQPPTATASPNGNSWSGQVVMVMSVVDPTMAQPIVPVCQLLLDTTLDSMFGLRSDSTGLFVTGKVSPLAFKISVLWTAIESPATLAAGMQVLVTSVANDILQPIINAVLANGVQIGDATFMGVLPMSNVFLSYGDHVVYAGLDLALPSVEEKKDEAVAFVRDLQVFE